MGYAKHINFISFQCISALTPWTGGSLRPPAPPSYLSTSCPLQHSSHPTNSLLNSTATFSFSTCTPWLPPYLPGSLPLGLLPPALFSTLLLTPSPALFSTPLPPLLPSRYPFTLVPSAPWYSSCSLSPGLPTSGPLPTFMAPYPPGSPPYSLGSLVPSGPLIHSPPPLRRSPAPPLPFHYLR